MALNPIARTAHAAFSGQFVAGDGLYVQSWQNTTLPPGWQLANSSSVVPPQTTKRVRVSIYPSAGDPKIVHRDASKTNNLTNRTEIIEQPILYITALTTGMTAGQTGWMVIEPL